MKFKYQFWESTTTGAVWGQNVFPLHSSEPFRTHGFRPAYVPYPETLRRSMWVSDGVKTV